MYEWMKRMDEKNTRKESVKLEWNNEIGSSHHHQHQAATTIILNQNQSFKRVFKILEWTDKKGTDDRNDYLHPNTNKMWKFVQVA